METEIRMVGWPKRECEVIPVTGMTRKDIMRLTNCPYMTAVTAEKRGYYIIDYLKKASLRSGDLLMARWTWGGSGRLYPFPRTSTLSKA